ncbi:MerR family transcriptional regulator [Christensenellaceae bacterium NSJ-44]|uniref:MerR family transcriptional regulator n=1 Tax=Luoshenia tenuis TaxID=2763654 RepID=A0A926CYS3_9FIRM|nr:MerR family transcriptional regulator [Luoshenia tenuis]MBC8528211.1 MerR family transcriptional regulator [Luoshenia tenuis]
MTYTIGQVAKKMGISAFTLRYYDKEGLLPFVRRDENGVRIFEESDLEFLRVIDCLKKTGMPIKDIRTFIVWTTQGDASLQQRYDMFMARKREVDRQLEQLLSYRDCIAYKCDYYEKALQAGTEAIHWQQRDGEPEMVLGRLAKISENEAEGI